MNDLRDFFKLLRYLLIFLVVVVGMAFYSKAHASSLCSSYDLTGLVSKGAGAVASTSQEIEGGLVSAPTTEIAESLLQSFVEPTRKLSVDKIQSKMPSDASWWCSHKDDISQVKFWGSGKYYWQVSVHYTYYNNKPKEPCETPKTDDQCKKGQRRQVTLPKSFWSQSTAEHKGCVIAVESPGVGIANMGDDRATGHVNMMGSTGKSWCANTGTADTTAQSIGTSGQFTPTTTPKDCPKGSVTMGGQSWCYTGASDGVTKPDGSVPDDGIHDNGTSDDGNGGDVDSSIDREPGDGSGGDGGGGDTGGGGDGSGGGTGDGNGISKGDIKDGVKEGVEEALGKGSGAPAPMIPPSVEGVEGGINGVMSRYKQRINNAPISSAFNNISFSVPSAGCSPWGIHLDYLDVNLQFDQCAFLNSHSGMIGALMMAVFAGLSLVVFLKA